MFSYEKRRKAVELLIQYDGRYAAVIHELGYPSREALRKWYYEYRENGNIHKKHKGGYSTAEKEAALEHYINHGRCISRTIRARIGSFRNERIGLFVKLWLPRNYVNY